MVARSLLNSIQLKRYSHITGIEVRWTPADGDGPEPASAKYREQMAQLRELQAQQGGGGQHPSQQKPQQDVGVLGKSHIDT